jgi:type IV pilus assembly protein PilW
MSRHPRRAQGFSIIELMTAVTIGLLILAGLASVFTNSSTSYRELKKTSEQIENGRYAIELLTQDLRHAGFYGEYYKLPAVPASSDPCTAPTDGTVSDTVNNFLSLPIDVYPAANFTSRPTAPTACAALLTNANLAPGSDIVVVRRADTVAATSITANLFYLQTTPDTADMQLGVAGTPTSTQNARLAASTLLRRNFTVAATGTPAQFPQVAAYVRKFRTHVYFVAPCSVPADGSSICTGATDDQNNPIPTLKRLEMGANGAFSIVPLVEGIQAMHVEYGVDNIPASADPGTGLVGDGVPDAYSHTRTIADLSNAVSAKVYVLAVNTQPTTDYTDNKTYVLGTMSTGVIGGSYKRHVYAAETRIINAAGRKEIPR